jgi:hypothetical protein
MSKIAYILIFACLGEWRTRNYLQLGKKVPSPIGWHWQEEKLESTLVYIIAGLSEKCGLKRLQRRYHITFGNTIYPLILIICSVIWDDLKRGKSLICHVTNNYTRSETTEHMLVALSIPAECRRSSPFRTMHGIIHVNNLQILLPKIADRIS